MAAYKTTLYRIRKERAPSSPTASLAPLDTHVESLNKPHRTDDAESETNPTQASDTVTDAVLGAMDQKKREQKFIKYGAKPMSLSKRLSQKKES
jgi:hypothetical protein